MPSVWEQILQPSSDSNAEADDHGNKLLHSRFGAYVSIRGGEEVPLRKVGRDFLKRVAADDDSAGRCTYRPFPHVRLLTAADDERADGGHSFRGPSTADAVTRIEFYLLPAAEGDGATRHTDMDGWILCEVGGGRANRVGVWFKIYPHKTEASSALPPSQAVPSPSAEVGLDGAAPRRESRAPKRPRPSPKPKSKTKSSALSRWGRGGWAPFVPYLSDEENSSEAEGGDALNANPLPQALEPPREVLLASLVTEECRRISAENTQMSLGDLLECIAAAVLARCRELGGRQPVLSLPPRLTIAAYSEVSAPPLGIAAPIAMDRLAVRALLAVSSPALAHHLRPYQLDAVVAALSAREGNGRRLGRILLADEMGLGKTLQAIGIVAALAAKARQSLSDGLPLTPSPFPLLIVCPASVRPMWATEAEQWLAGCLPPTREGLGGAVGHFVWSITGHDTRLGTMETPPVVVVSKQLVGTLHAVDFAGRSWGTIVVDESHQLHTTLMGAEDGCHTTRCIADLCTSSPYTIMLSGTPSLATPFDMFQQLQCLRPDLFAPAARGGGGRFTKEDFGFGYTEALVGHSGGGYLRFGGCVRLAELRGILDSCLWIRRERRDLERCSAALPDGGAAAGAGGGEEEVMPSPDPMHAVPKVHRIVVCVKGRATDAFPADDGAECDDGDDGSAECLASEGDLSLPSAAKEVAGEGVSCMTPYHAVGLAKVAVLGPLLKRVLQAEVLPLAGASVVLFAHHLDVLDEVQRMAASFIEKAGASAADVLRRIDGSTHMGARELMLNQFQDPLCGVRVMVAAITACGVGISQMAGATVAVFCELPPNVSWLLQAEGRVARPRSDSTRNHSPGGLCRVYVCVANNLRVDRRLWTRLEQGYRDVASMMTSPAQSTPSPSCGAAEALVRARLSGFFEAAQLGSLATALEQARRDSAVESGGAILGVRSSVFTGRIQLVARRPDGLVHLLCSVDPHSSHQAFGPLQAELHALLMAYCARMGLARPSSRAAVGYSSQKLRQLAVSGAVTWEAELVPDEAKSSVQAASQVDACPPIAPTTLSQPWVTPSARSFLMEDGGGVRPPRYAPPVSDVQSGSVDQRPCPRGAQWAALMVPVSVNGQPVMTRHRAAVRGGLLPSNVLCLHCCDGEPLPWLRAFPIGEPSGTEEIIVRWGDICPTGQPATATPYLYLFCTGACRESYFFVRSSHAIRRTVGRYDKGVCNYCQLDGEALLAELVAAGPVVGATTAVGAREQIILARQPEFSRHPLLLRRLAEQPTMGRIWHADHATPVRDGGGMAGLNNLQTLCVVCHAAKTRLEESRFGKKKASW